MKPETGRELGVALCEAPHLTTASTVCVAGSFNGWAASGTQLAWREAECAFVGVVRVPPGLHQYKFVVDGLWCHSKQGACVTDAQGNVNNVCCPSPGPLNLERLG